MVIMVIPPLFKEGRKGEKGKKAILSNHLFAFFPFSLLPPGTIRAGAQSPQGLSHVRHHVRKFLGFRGRNPLNPEALRFQAEVFQH
jgi:hypothetical protein